MSTPAIVAGMFGGAAVIWKAMDSAGKVRDDRRARIYLRRGRRAGGGAAAAARRRPPPPAAAARRRRRRQA
jgi:hypothetical protein